MTAKGVEPEIVRIITDYKKQMVDLTDNHKLEIE